MSKVIILIIVLIGFTESLFPGALDDYSQACMDGDAKGCYQAGAIYCDGLGIRQDAEVAKGYFKMACDMGDTRVCAELNDKTISRPDSSHTMVNAYDSRLKNWIHHLDGIATK